MNGVILFLLVGLVAGWLAGKALGTESERRHRQSGHWRPRRCPWRLPVYPSGDHSAGPAATAIQAGRGHRRFCHPFDSAAVRQEIVHQLRRAAAELCRPDLPHQQAIDQAPAVDGASVGRTRMHDGVAEPVGDEPTHHFEGRELVGDPGLQAQGIKDRQEIFPALGQVEKDQGLGAPARPG